MSQWNWGELDSHLFREGKHPRLHEKLGAHAVPGGVHFATWAPSAAAVSVIGDFNGWTPGANPLEQLDDTGVWHGTVKGVGQHALYKLHIRSKHNNYEVAKADPFALRHEVAPGTASIVWSGDHAWGDAAWMKSRTKKSDPTAPISIYEVHLGSWRRKADEGNRSLSYREIAPLLVEYVQRLGFTHVELMPLTEHPFFGSWGYETTGYFAATSRYGYPDELMELIDALHQANIGVILDWVPAHFPTDEHGLVYFDGTPLYEHPDRKLGFHPEWNTSMFDYGKQEVRSFLLSSALFWLERFHVDGLRVDGVASMLYRNYGRKDGEWIPNNKGGHEYFEAVELLQRLNEAIHREQPGAVTMAEESTAWPRVTGSPIQGGLGFSYKWDMGWMHDTLRYLARDPVHRCHHHGDLTFRGMYAWSEKFVMPLSHDEVVHGKGSLINKMAGDRWQKFANLRLLYAYQWSQPGKKLLFMGGEMAQWAEWNHDSSLDWHLLDDPDHGKLSILVGALNHLYRSEPAMHELDADPRGFQWVIADDKEHSVFVYERIANNGDRIVCALNFTPVPRPNYRVGVSQQGTWREILNTDAAEFGGTGHGNLGSVMTSPVRIHGRSFALNLTLPPLGAVFFKR